MRIAGAAARDSAQGATTEAGFRVGEVTSGGTIALVIFIGLLSGVVGAVYYLIFRPWLAWAGRWRGVGFGLVLFAAASATSDMLNSDNPDFIILRNEALLVVLIGALFLTFGLLIDWLFGLLEKRLPGPEPAHDPARFLYGSLVGFGLLLTTGTVPMMLFGSNICDCDPPIVTSSFVSLTAVATLVWWLTALLKSPSPRMHRFAQVLGYVGVGGVLISGLIRATTDIAEILR
jgi:hypothetical protein